MADLGYHRGGANPTGANLLFGIRQKLHENEKRLRGARLSPPRSATDMKQVPFVNKLLSTDKRIIILE